MPLNMLTQRNRSHRKRVNQQGAILNPTKVNLSTICASHLNGRLQNYATFNP
jgi:hypothetical protein